MPYFDFSKAQAEGLAMMLAYQKLMVAASSVVMQRSLSLATGTMSPAEFNRMCHEKPGAFAGALVAATGVLSTGGSSAKAAHAFIKPISKRARANSRRLSRR